MKKALHRKVVQLQSCAQVLYWLCETKTTPVNIVVEELF